MKLEHNEVILENADEQSALDVQANHIGAESIGNVWRAAVCNTVLLAESLDAADMGSFLDICIMPGVAAVSFGPETYTQKALAQRERQLLAMCHMVLAVEMETLPGGTE